MWHARRVKIPRSEWLATNRFPIIFVMMAEEVSREAESEPPPPLHIHLITVDTLSRTTRELPGSNAHSTSEYCPLVEWFSGSVAVRSVYLLKKWSDPLFSQGILCYYKYSILLVIQYTSSNHTTLCILVIHTLEERLRIWKIYSARLTSIKHCIRNYKGISLWNLSLSRSFISSRIVHKTYCFLS